MLFMKGSKSEPKCKFSTAIVKLLKEICAEFSTFDILEDQVVREKLKTFSNWPTYPQVNLLKCLNYAILLNKKLVFVKLYINGELIGGLDIVKELNETGELKDLLKLNDNKANLNDR